MLQDLKQGTFHLSTNWVDIPTAYLEVVDTGHAGSTVTPRGAVTMVSLAPSTASNTSTLTPDTAAARTNATRLNNPTNDTDFTGITIRPGGAPALIREHRPPTNDAGNELCVAWWTRGGCFPNCGRRAAHVPFASLAERTRLLAYVREHLQAPATST